MNESGYVSELVRRISTIVIEHGIDSDSQILELIEENVFKDMSSSSMDEIVRTIDRVFTKIRGRYGPLEKYIEDDSINEIMVNGINRIFIEKDNHIILTDECFDSVEELESVIRKIASLVHREISELNPILDARLEDGSRINAIYRNIAINGPSLTIRKFRRNRITMDELIKKKTLTAECACFLKKAVEAGYNIFVSGGTSSGKTTFLNALAEYIPEDERVVVIEDSAELQLDNISNIVRLECRNSNFMGQGKVNMSMLIKASLRMRPDKLIIGEVRGKEVSDMLQALNSGHSGMSTGHGNSSQGMLRRMESMYLMGVDMPVDAIRAQIIEAIDILVHLGRTKKGNRVILEINELLDIRDGGYLLNRLYYRDENFNLVESGKLKNRVKLNLQATGV